MRRLFFLSLLLVSCATVKPSEASLKVTSDARLIYRGGEEKTVKAGEVVRLKGDDLILVESAGMAPVYLIPIENDGIKAMEISPRPLGDLVALDMMEGVYRNIGLIIEDYNRIQREISLGNYDTAERMISDLKLRHPGFHYIDFLHATSLLMQGKTEEGKAKLEEALRKNPDNIAGLELLKRLKSE